MPCREVVQGRYLRLKRHKGASVATAALAHQPAKIVYAVVEESRPYRRFRYEPLRGGPPARIVAWGLLAGLNPHTTSFFVTGGNFEKGFIDAAHPCMIAWLG